jgi:Icc-related predicted phosphoesterase
MIGRRRRRRSAHTRLFFATDIHGSDRCFRKWLNAGSVYAVDALIMGGDLTGKILVPIVTMDGQWQAELNGEEVAAASELELEALIRRIRQAGRYPIVVTAEEKSALENDPQLLDTRFREVIAASVKEWAELAAERLADARVPGYIILGNDDFPELAELLREASTNHFHYAEEGICRLPDGRELVSLGYSTPTPWKTDRELTEDELAERLEGMTSSLEQPRTSVFNLHCPPLATHLDQAPKLDDELRPVAGAGGIEMVSVGSRAVRAAIERLQPCLGVHGHVHESVGMQELGRTVCLNPGSEYGDGILRGALITLDEERVASWQFVQA